MGKLYTRLWMVLLEKLIYDMVSMTDLISTILSGIPLKKQILTAFQNFIVKISINILFYFLLQNNLFNFTIKGTTGTKKVQS